MRWIVVLGMLVVSFITVSARAQESEEGEVTETAPETDTDTNEASEPAQGIMDAGKVFVEVGTERLPVPLPAAAVAIHQQGETLYVAMGRHGAAVFDISNPAEVRQIGATPAGADEIVGFQVVDGEVWIRAVSTKIVPMVAGAVPSAPAAAAQEASAAPSAQVRDDEKRAQPIRILEVSKGEVTLDVGSADGVQVGDRFSVFKSVSVKGVGKETFEGTELAAVVQVTAVNEHRCIASLWRGDRATLKDTVTPHHKDHRMSRVYPRHLTDLGEVAVTLRPILNVDGPIGFGALNEIAVSYWGDGYVVGVRLEPFGFAFGDSGSALVLNATAEAGYDARAFGIGLGVGMNATTFLNNAFSITQSVRLGTRDGLNLVTRNAFSLRRRSDIYYDYTRGEDVQGEEELGFEWGGLQSRINVPLTGRTALFFGGGGSESYFFGEAGVHAWLLGNGDAGSLALSAAAGAAGVTPRDDNDDYYDENGIYIEPERVSCIGPMISLGLNYRFGFKRR